jgi:hypothetical protein
MASWDLATFNLIMLYYTVKKGCRFSRPQQECHLPNSHWAGIIKLFLSRESVTTRLGTGKPPTFSYIVEMYER